MKKRILIDARMVGAVGHGIGNYVLELAEALYGDRPYSLEFLVSPHLPQHTLTNYPLHKTEISFLHPRESVSLGTVIRKIAPDLYHSPSFSSLTRYPCPYVQTIHDLNHLHFGSMLQKIYYRTLLLPSLRGAEAIITVSDSAKWEISHWLKRHKSEKHIFIVKNIIRPYTANKSIEKWGLKQYFFTLSNPKPHKNLPFLQNAYRDAKKQNPSLPPLVINTAGVSSDGIIFLSNLNHEEVGTLLQNAHAFFFPSLYEGFGRPPVESALMGVKPIVSNIPVLQEALKGVKEAEFLNPQNASSWTDAFLRAASQEPIPVSPESKDWIRTQYSLEEAARSMDAIYCSALNLPRQE